jgi:hypothetical protein
MRIPLICRCRTSAAMLFLLLMAMLPAVDTPPTITTPAAAVPALITGKTSRLSVVGADDGGATALTYAWSASGAGTVTFSATGTNAAKTVTATFSAPGEYTCVATVTDASGQNATSSVAVQVNSTLTSFVISPTTAVMNPGASRAFAATAKNQFGTILTGEPLVWSTTGIGSVDQAGVFAAGAVPASGTVTVTDGAKTATATVRVNAAPSVALAPIVDVTGTTAAVSALGSDPDNATATLKYTWSASGPKTVSFAPNGSNAAATAVATFRAAGTYTVTVTVKDPVGLTASASQPVVVQVTPTTIAVAPNTAATVINPGATKTFTATVKDQFAAAIAAIAAPAVLWSVDPASAGTMTAAGVLTGGTPVQATVRATFGSLSGSAPVRINAAPTTLAPVSTAVNPLSGTTAEFLVQGADDVNPLLLSYTWSATGPKTVTFVPRSGVNQTRTTATFGKVGSYSIIATMKDQQGLTVTSSLPCAILPVTTSASLNPATAILKTAATRAFAVQLRDQFSTVIPGATIPPGVLWSVAGVGAITPAGLYSAGSVPGTAIITAQIPTTPPLTATAAIQVTTIQAVATPVITPREWRLYGCIHRPGEHESDGCCSALPDEWHAGHHHRPGCSGGRRADNPVHDPERDRNRHGKASECGGQRHLHAPSPTRHRLTGDGNLRGCPECYAELPNPGCCYSLHDGRQHVPPRYRPHRSARLQHADSRGHPARMDDQPTAIVGVHAPGADAGHRACSWRLHLPDHRECQC